MIQYSNDLTIVKHAKRGRAIIMAEKILSMAEIMEAQDITEQTVPVPEWGGSVKVRSISHRTMKNIRKKVAAQSGTDEPSEDDVEKYILIEGMIEPKIDEDEYEQLLEKSSGAVMKILTAIMSSSKSEDKSVKEQEKSSSTRRK
jgi:hypothetical protein